MPLQSALLSSTNERAKNIYNSSQSARGRSPRANTERIGVEVPVGGLRRGAVARDFFRYHNRLEAAGTDSPGDWANKTLTPFCGGRRIYRGKK